MFTAEQIKVANATSRSNGASAINKDGSIRAIVPRYVADNIDKREVILDFGAGKNAVHTKWLRAQGFNAVAYDFGSNLIDGVHDKDALSKQYTMIMASNVLNVQSSLSMLLKTLMQIDTSLKPGGELICNYPTSPRKMELTADDLKDILQAIFRGKIEKVGGTSSAPLWRVTKAPIH
jgi:hypothetical protein